jgi:hypothetical protein
MNKTKLVLVGLIVAALCFAGFVYAFTTTLSWTQNLKVPLGSARVYYEATEITDGSNQTGIWTWDPIAHSFNTTITINNTGLSDINVDVEYSIDPMWTPIGFGMQTLLYNSSRMVNLSIYNSTASTGDSVEPFTVTMTIVP